MNTGLIDFLKSNDPTSDTDKADSTISRLSVSDVASWNFNQS